MKFNLNAKLVAKIAILTAVMIGAFVAATVQRVPSADGGPLIGLCTPDQMRTGHCSLLPTAKS